MFDLNLEYDENIIVETENVQHIAPKEEDLEELVLTNKNLIYVRKIKNGLFAKATIEVDKIPLGQIKVYNGIAQAKQIRNIDHGICLQVQFSYGQELFVFEESPKKITPQWVREISLILVGKLPPEPQKTSVFDSIGNLTGLSAGLKSVANTFVQTINDATQQLTGESRGTQNSREYIPQSVQENAYQETNCQTTNYQESPIEATNIDINLEEEQEKGNNDTVKFCANCGARINEGAKFCQECGTPINAKIVKTVTPPPVSNEQSKPEQNTKRQQEYVGKLYKCPNCGNIVNPSDAVCGGCGFHLSGKKAMGSVTEFQQQLFQVEMTRQDKKKGFWSQPEVLDATDKQIIALIKTYPIPNTIDDIVEFMHLAIANIDVVKSKKSKFNTDTWDGGSREREISNAWVGKMEQIYNKAELYFPNEPEFVHIKELYSEKMKALNLK